MCFLYNFLQPRTHALVYDPPPPPLYYQKRVFGSMSEIQTCDTASVARSADHIELQVTNLWQQWLHLVAGGEESRTLAL